jgi:hypothetical protein
MRSRLNFVLIGALTAVSGCADGGADLVSPENLQGPSYAVVANAPGDDTEAIRSAINNAAASGGLVYFPALPNGEEYIVTSTIGVPSGTTLYGDGPTLSKIRVDHEGEAFQNSRGSDIALKHLGFRSTGSDPSQWALGTYSSHNITVENVHATGLGILYSGTAAPTAPISDSDYSTNVSVLNSTGTGKCLTDFSNCPSTNDNSGIVIAYTKHTRVTGNTFRYYTSGIQWHGGGYANYDPSGASHPRQVFDLWIEDNEVYDVYHGIWGSRGDSVIVHENTVARCLDVCLDAELSRNVRFTRNTARDAGNGVLAVFFWSEGIRFGYNTVSQTGNWNGSLLFTNNTDSSPNGVSVWVHNNEFRWDKPSGYGKVEKAPTAFFGFSNNTLVNTVINFVIPDWQGGYTAWHGGVQITGNTLYFDRYLGGSVPAIRAGMTTGHNDAAATPVNANWDLDIGGNDIRSTTLQNGYGIHVLQPSTSSKVESWIYWNKVRNFSTSIHVQQTSVWNSGWGGYAPYFLISENGLSRGISQSGSVSVTKSGNYVIPDF